MKISKKPVKPSERRNEKMTFDVVWKILIFWVLLMIAFSIRDLNAAEPHAIVSFNDAEHLAALTDSVVGVCDTITMTITRMEEGHSATADSFRFVLDTVGTAITCRELVCVTARWPEVVMDTLSTSYDGFFDDIFPTKTIPGEAIINYRRVTK